MGTPADIAEKLQDGFVGRKDLVYLLSSSGAERSGPSSDVDVAVVLDNVTPLPAHRAIAS